VISPGVLRRLTGRTLAKAWHDRILGLSAEAAFWQLLSLPSLFLGLIAALGYVSKWAGPETVKHVREDLLKAFSRAFSDTVVNQLIAPTINEVLSEGRADIVSIGFVIALWAGSSATATFVNTTTIAYGMRDLRGAVRSRLIALAIYIGALGIGVVLLPALVLGPQLLPKIIPESARPWAGRIIHDLYWPVVVILLLAGLSTFYHLAPPRRLPWRRGVPGAVLALVIFLGGSAGLREYIAFVVDHNHAYGTLAAPIATLLFFFILAFGVLLGAELNASIEQTWPTGWANEPSAGIEPAGWPTAELEAQDGPAGNDS
jgi:membrane protein